MVALIFLFFNLVASLFKAKSRLEAENAALRHQLTVLQGKVIGGCARRCCYRLSSTTIAAQPPLSSGPCAPRCLRCGVADWGEQFCSDSARSVRVQYFFPQTGGTPNENQLGSRKTLFVDRSGWSGRRYVAAVVRFRLHEPEYGRKIGKHE